MGNYCEKGHYYDPARFNTCPLCNPDTSKASATRYDESGGLGSSSFIQARKSFMSSGSMPTRRAPVAANSSQPLARQAAAHRAPAGATRLDGDEERLRLMGFLVVIFSKYEDEFSYHRLNKGVNFIGRFGSRSNIELRDQEVSGQHALIVCNNESTMVIDLDSSNGVEINDQRANFAVLQEGDVIRIGRTDFLYTPFDWEAED